MPMDAPQHSLADPTDPPAPAAALLLVGNSRARSAWYADGGVHHVQSHPVQDAPAIAQALHDRLAENQGSALLVASVNAPAAREVEHALRRAWSLDDQAPWPVTLAYAGADLPVPMPTTVAHPQRLGVDRLLCCLAAYSMAKQACIVIDAGTAITVDFVDGQGVHHGGAIAPGVGAMLAGLVHAAPALPTLNATQALAMRQPQDRPWGEDTQPAMALGVRAAAVGMVHDLIDRFALAYGAYPRVVATGGDAPALFEHDELVEHVVPDLQLVGLARAYEASLRRDDDDDPRADRGQPD
ncbi:MAG: hypothetical protein KatS3mg103_0013 [Phycisphaerales bacterium]|nr:MAG: hypothetical protein KatS3mg103_0013 [Phycisphaerales bacterium]